LFGFTVFACREDGIFFYQTAKNNYQTIKYLRFKKHHILMLFDTISTQDAEGKTTLCKASRGFSVLKTGFFLKNKPVLTQSLHTTAIA